jgi:hypothetical protein
MDATATRMTAEQYFAVSVEGDRKRRNPLAGHLAL